MKQMVSMLYTQNITFLLQFMHSVFDSLFYLSSTPLRMQRALKELSQQLALFSKHKSE